MFKRFTDGYFALGLAIGLISATGLILWIFSINYCPDAPCYYQKPPNQTETYNQRWFPLPWHPNATLQPKPPTTEGAPKNHEYDDLVAQENMARATNLIAWASVVSVALSAFGIWLLVSNLSVTRKTSQDQTRAYVHIKTVHWDDAKGGDIRFMFFVQNSGQTPATHFKIIALSEYVPHGNVETLNWACECKDEKTWFGLPNDTYTAPITLSVDIGNLRGDGILHVFGLVEYNTFYGETFQSEFSFITKEKFGAPGVKRDFGYKMSRSTTPIKTFRQIN